MKKVKKPDNHRPLLYVLFKKFGLRGSLQIFREDIWFDFSKGVNTAIPVSRRFLYAKNQANNLNRYVASTFGIVNHALEFANTIVSLDESGFVDMGSGKAKALIAASNYPFRTIRGVDISRRMHTIALKNLLKLGLTTQVEVELGNAESIALQSHERVIYLFNPFTGDVLDRCLKNLLATKRNGPGVLIYVNPTELDHVKQYFKLIRTEFAQPGHCEISYFLLNHDN